jgi:hypothetical protein
VSRGEGCGGAEVIFTRGDEESAEWYRVDPDYDGPDADTTKDCRLTSDGSPSVSYLSGVHASRDGRWLFLRAGVASSTTTRAAVCAIDLESGSLGAYDSYTEVMPGSAVQGVAWAMASQPHVADDWYVSSIGGPGCDACTPDGIFELQRRRRADATSGGWVTAWDLARVSGDDLQARGVKDLDWGWWRLFGEVQDPILVATSAGQWDGSVSW